MSSSPVFETKWGKYLLAFVHFVIQKVYRNNNTSTPNDVLIINTWCDLASKISNLNDLALYVVAQHINMHFSPDLCLEVPLDILNDFTPIILQCAQKAQVLQNYWTMPKRKKLSMLAELLSNTMNENIIPQVIVGPSYTKSDDNIDEDSDKCPSFREIDLDADENSMT